MIDFEKEATSLKLEARHLTTSELLSNDLTVEAELSAIDGRYHAPNQMDLGRRCEGETADEVMTPVNVSLKDYILNVCEPCSALCNFTATAIRILTPFQLGYISEGVLKFFSHGRPALDALNGGKVNLKQMIVDYKALKCINGLWLYYRQHQRFIEDKLGLRFPQEQLDHLNSAMLAGLNRAETQAALLEEVTNAYAVTQSKSDTRALVAFPREGTNLFGKEFKRYPDSYMHLLLLRGQPCRSDIVLMLQDAYFQGERLKVVSQQVANCLSTTWKHARWVPSAPLTAAQLEVIDALFEPLSKSSPYSSLETVHQAASNV